MGETYLEAMPLQRQLLLFGYLPLALEGGWGSSRSERVRSHPLVF